MWGRNSRPSNATLVIILSILIFCPFIPYIFIQTTYNKQNHFLTSLKLFDVFWYVCGWIIFQIILSYLPNLLIIPFYKGGYQNGQHTPAGNILKYNINGLQALLITIITYYYLDKYNYFKFSFIAKNWINIYFIMNLFGYALAIICYVKANIWKFDEDNKYTGNIFYDFMMGIE